MQHALRMDHQHHHIMPHPRVVLRRPHPRLAADDPLLPALPVLPDEGFGGDALLRDPDLGLGRRLGEGQFLSFFRPIVANHRDFPLAQQIFGANSDIQQTRPISSTTSMTLLAILV